MAIFQYQAYDTPIHRVHPILKVAFLAMTSLLLGYVADPLWKLPMLVLVFAVAWLAKLPFREYWKLLVFISIMMILATGYQSLFLVNPDYFKVYPKELVSRVLLNLTPASFPILGHTALTVGSLIWLARLPLTAVTGSLLLATFIHSTTLNDMLQVLSELHVPFPGIYIAMVAFRITPDLAKQMSIIQTAQKLRGWAPPQTRNPIKKIRAVAPLLIPLARYTIKCVDVITLSVQNRGFGAGHVTGMRPLSLKPLDKLALLVGAAVFLVMIYGMFQLNWGNI
jgi:energy-coupling factor transport system permease protein